MRGGRAKILAQFILNWRHRQSLRRVFLLTPLQSGRLSLLGARSTRVARLPESFFWRGDGVLMRNMWKCALGLLVGLGGLAGNAGAQFKNGSQATELNIPRASQRGTVSQRIGLTDITITYHRPAAGGREIWGKTVPYGKVWRAGANENTTITFSDDVSVEGKSLAAGTYGLHAIPDKDQWTIIFSKNSTSWGSFSYDEKEDP